MTERTIERRDPVARDCRDRLGEWLTLHPAYLSRLPREPVEALTTLVEAAWFASAEAAELSHVNRDLRETARRLGDLANKDSLTSLPNRRAIDERLAIEWGRSHRYGRPLALVLADVDRLKAVNDLHGHQAGDVLLRTVAARMSAVVRTGDLVGRLSGDEFIVVCPETDAEAAAHVAHKLFRAVCSEPVQVDAGEIPIGLSLGWATASGLSDVTDLIRAADEALYRTKHGRPQT